MSLLHARHLPHFLWLAINWRTSIHRAKKPVVKSRWRQSFKMWPGGISLPPRASMSSSSRDRKCKPFTPALCTLRKKIPIAEAAFLRKVAEAHLGSSQIHWTYPLLWFILYHASPLSSGPLSKAFPLKMLIRRHPEYLEGKLHSFRASHTYWSFQLVLFEVNLRALTLLHTKYRGEKWPVSLGNN